MWEIILSLRGLMSSRGGKEGPETMSSGDRCQTLNGHAQSLPFKLKNKGRNPFRRGPVESLQDGFGEGPDGTDQQR